MSWNHSSTSGQVEVERVEQVDGRARGVHGDVRRHLEELLRVVEDDPHAGSHQSVGGILRGGRGHRQDPDDDVLVLDHGVQVGYGVDLDVAVALADQLRIDVEDRNDLEPVVGEDVRAGDRLTEVPGPEQDDVVLTRAAQDLADLVDERVDAVAHAPLPELPEARQVAPDLGRVD